MSDTMSPNAMSNNTMSNHAMSNTMSPNAMSNNTMSNSDSREGSMAIIDDLSDISLSIIGMVVDVLDPSIRESHGVGSLSGCCSIISLLGLEVWPTVVISNIVLVCVGGDLVRVDVEASARSSSMTNHSHSMTNYTMTNTDNTSMDAISDGVWGGGVTNCGGDASTEDLGGGSGEEKQGQEGLHVGAV